MRPLPPFHRSRTTALNLPVVIPSGGRHRLTRKHLKKGETTVCSFKKSVNVIVLFTLGRTHTQKCVLYYMLLSKKFHVP